MPGKKKEAAPGATGTASAKEMLLTVYQPGGEKSTRNELMELRVGRGLPAREMVAVVQELYPKYDKTMQSKCEHGEEYGVLLRPDALTALYSRFAPDVLEPESGPDMASTG